MEQNVEGEREQVMIPCGKRAFQADNARTKIGHTSVVLRNSRRDEQNGQGRESQGAG